MSYSLNPNDVLEYIIMYQLDGQTLMNTFHYKYSEVAAPQTNAAVLLSDWLAAAKVDATGTYLALKAAASNKVTFTTHRIQIIYPVRRAYADGTLGAVGSRGDTAMPSGVSGCVFRKSDLAGRGTVGRIEVGGMLTDDALDGYVTPTYTALLSSIATTLILNRDIGVEPASLQPILFKRSAPVFSPLVSQVGVRSTVRYMTRRTVGRGI